MITPALSFIATANAVVHCGATPVFADVDPPTCNLDPQAAESAITPRTKAIVHVHQLGLPATIAAFQEISRRHGIAIVEDAACALGTRYRGRPIGGHSQLVCFSFHPRKVISTGEGGMVLTNSDEYAQRLRLLRQHGMSVPDTARHGATQLVIEQYVRVGYNYRMSDVHAALGLAQMDRLDELVRQRRALAAQYDRAFANNPLLLTPFVPEYAEPNYQSYILQLTDDAPIARDALLRALLARGVAAKPGIMTIHREPAYRGYRAGPLPHTERIGDRSLLLPLYPQMTEAEQQQVIATVRASLDALLEPAGCGSQEGRA